MVKRTARAILLDGDELVLIKRTKSDQPPYWITPGGGVEGEDETVIAALHREVDEELGAEVSDVVPVFVDTVPYTASDLLADEGTPEEARALPPDAVKVQHFFVCRLVSMDLSRRHGPEVVAPRGTYEIVRLPFSRAGVTSVNVVPPALRDYLESNIEGVRGLLSEDLG